MCFKRSHSPDTLPPLFAPTLSLQKSRYQATPRCKRWTTLHPIHAHFSNRDAPSYCHAAQTGKRQLSICRNRAFDTFLSLHFGLILAKHSHRTKIGACRTKLGSLVMSAKVRCKLTEKCFGKNVRRQEKWCFSTVLCTWIVRHKETDDNCYGQVFLNCALNRPCRRTCLHLDYIEFNFGWKRNKNYKKHIWKSKTLPWISQKLMPH